jgi:hypothetical protein
MRKRTDLNQSSIVRSLRALGFSVFITSNLGDGFPDLCVGVRGHNIFFEVKRPGRAGDMTPAERLFHSEWRGQVDVITTLPEALEVIQRQTT